jgi:glutamyl-Q tRNA(Asp) synthetase
MGILIMAGDSAPRNLKTVAVPPRPVFRFAPSPNGLLHLGHAFSALLNLEMARKAGARMLLRIEDIDTSRCTPANEARMLADLEWVGFEWDEPPMRQSLQFERYSSVIDDLFEEGLAYPSLLTRREIVEMVDAITSGGRSWPADPDGVPIYPGTERDLDPRGRAAIIDSGRDFAMRLDVAAATKRVGDSLQWQETGEGPDGDSGLILANPPVWGDVVLGRKEVPASYHLSAVLDDALQGVTHVVRGRDLFHATSVHRLLQELLRLPVPDYHHHELILDATGRKLSKSLRSTALRHLREAGTTAGDIRRMIGLG